MRRAPTAARPISSRPTPPRRSRAWTPRRRRRGRVVVHPFNDPAVMAGQGTVGLELCEQVDEVTQVVVPVGGGGLISGVATAVKALCPNARVIAVEPAVIATVGGLDRRGLAGDAARGRRASPTRSARRASAPAPLAGADASCWTRPSSSARSRSPRRSASSTRAPSWRSSRPRRRRSRRCSRGSSSRCRAPCSCSRAATSRPSVAARCSRR